MTYNIDGIRIQGEEDFHKKITELIKSVRPDKIEPTLMRGAQLISRAARRDAPVRKSWGARNRPAPGNLKKSVKTKKLRRLFGHPAPAIAALDRKKAPHAHLVHEGTKGETRIAKRGKKYKGRTFGRMPGDPFLARAWNSKKADVLAYIEKNVKGMIEGAVK